VAGSHSHDLLQSSDIRIYLHETFWERHLAVITGILKRIDEHLRFHKIRCEIPLKLAGPDGYWTLDGANKPPLCFGLSQALNQAV